MSEKSEIEILEGNETIELKKQQLDQLKDYREKLANLSEEEKIQRNLYLKRIGPRGEFTNEEISKISIQSKIPNGQEIQGPTTGFSSIDKPWLFKYTDDEISTKIECDNFYEYLLNSSIDFPNEIAFEFFDLKISKRQLFQEICRVEDMLVNEKNIQKDDLVCLAPINQPESMYIIYALRKIGAKVSIIDPRANAFTLKKDILDSEIKPKLFISSSQAKKEFQQIKNEIDIDTMFISPFQSIPKKMISKVLTLADKLKFGKAYSDEMDYNFYINKYKDKFYPIDYVKKFTKKDTEDKDYDFIMHTGGTTGVHKGVELCDKAFNNTVLEHNALMDGIVFRGDCLVNPMPQFITYGLTTMHLSLCKGFNMKMLMIPTAKEFTKAIIKSKARLAFGGPIHWEGFIEYLKKTNYKDDLKFLRVAVAGGEKIPLTTKEKVNNFFKSKKNDNVLIDGYGLSEVTGVFSVALNENTIGSQGQPLSHNSIAVYDRDKQQEVKIGEVGELYVQSESMMGKYHQNEEETKNVFYEENGNKWLKTGDAGFVNGQGEVVVIGRYKRIFVCGVDKVYQETMEECISELPFVKKCVVTEIPVYDKELKAVPKAHIVINDEYKKTMTQKEMEDEIVKQVSIKISSKVYPRYFEFQPAESILYTPNGKVDFTNMTKLDQIHLNNLYPTEVKPFEQVDKFASNIHNSNDEEEQKTNTFLKR